MSLNKAPLPIQFSGGVDLRTDPKQVAATKLLDLQNGVFTRETTISKRNGYEALSTAIQDNAGDITDARGLGLRDDEIVLFTDKRCYSQRPSADRWADAGEVAATTVTTLPIARTGSYQTQPDIAERNGIRVVAWEDSRGGVWCAVIESATGRILRSQTQLDSSINAQQPRCLAVGEVLHVLWTRKDLGQILIAVISPVTPAAAPVQSVLTNDLDTTKPFYDAEPTVNGDSVTVNLRPGLIAWAQAGGGYRVGWLSPSGVLGSPASGLSSVATYLDVLAGPIGVAWDSQIGGVAVVWASAAGLSARFAQGTALSAPTRTVASAGVGGVLYSRVTAAFGAVAADGVPSLYWAAESFLSRSDLCFIDAGTLEANGTTLDAISTRLAGHGLVSRAWYDGSDLAPEDTDGNEQLGDVYVGIAHTVRFFPYVAALRLSDSNGIASPNNTIVSRLMPGEAAGSLMRPTGSGTRQWTQHLPSVLAVDLTGDNLYSRQHAFCVPYRIQLSSTNGDQFSEQGIKLATLNFDAGYQTVQLGRGLYLASSCPMHYDGEAWHEADFHTAPDIGFDTAGAPVLLSTLAVNGGAGVIPNGTYLFAFWYEAVDAQGELHRGAVSTKILVTMSGGPGVFSIALPTCRLTQFDNVRICAARSIQGATGTDSSLPLFKITNNDVTVTTGNNRYADNDLTLNSVTLVDNLTDAQLVLLEPLYTNGGKLSNAPSPWAGNVIATGKNRLFWTDSSDPNLVRYSQQGADDTALEAPIELAQSVDAFGGPITAIGILDDAVVPFKETAIFIFGGPGPLDDPAASADANAFTPSELLTSDVGCSSTTSIGQTPVGITFQSRKGIKMLARQRQVVDIGKPVSGLDAQHYTRTTLLPDRKSIIYLTDTAEGFSLLWDYDRDQWSKFSNHIGLDAIVADGVYHYLRTDSRVFRETPGEYRDDNSRIPLVIETAFIHFAQYLQGWQKILYAYFLGAYISPHAFSMRYRLDYNDGYSPAILVDVNTGHTPSLYGDGLYGAGPYGGLNDGAGRYQHRIHLNRRCQAISFLITDVEAADDFGASFELSEMLLIGGGIGVDFKVGAARSA